MDATEPCHPTTERIEGGHVHQCGTCGDWYDVPCDCSDRDDAIRKALGAGVSPEAASILQDELDR